MKRWNSHFCVCETSFANNSIIKNRQDDIGVCWSHSPFISMTFAFLVRNYAYSYGTLVHFIFYSLPLSLQIALRNSIVSFLKRLPTIIKHDVIYISPKTIRSKILKQQQYQLLQHQHQPTNLSPHHHHHHLP